MEGSLLLSFFLVLAKVIVPKLGRNGGMARRRSLFYALCDDPLDTDAVRCPRPFVRQSPFFLRGKDED